VGNRGAGQAGKSTRDETGPRPRQLRTEQVCANKVLAAARTASARRRAWPAATMEGHRRAGRRPASENPLQVLALARPPWWLEGFHAERPPPSWSLPEECHGRRVARSRSQVAAVGLVHTNTPAGPASCALLVADAQSTGRVSPWRSANQWAPAPPRRGRPKASSGRRSAPASFRAGLERRGWCSTCCSPRVYYRPAARPREFSTGKVQMCHVGPSSRGRAVPRGLTRQVQVGFACLAEHWAER